MLQELNMADTDVHTRAHLFCPLASLGATIPTTTVHLAVEGSVVDGSQEPHEEAVYHYFSTRHQRGVATNKGRRASHLQDQCYREYKTLQSSRTRETRRGTEGHLGHRNRADLVSVSQQAAYEG